MMLLRFSERVAINDNDHIAFGAQVRSGDESKEAVLLADASGIAQVAIVGNSAPGGGRFSDFGLWPGLGPDDMVAFIAAIDEGPGALGLFVSQKPAKVDASPWRAITGQWQDHTSVCA